jgi:Zn-dependent protease
MSTNDIIDIAQTFLCFIVIITFHEAAHAWMAWKRGDDTARLLGRITLNPVAHMEVIGTVVLPLGAMILSASGSMLGSFIIGWGKPVPFNPSRLKNRSQDGMWIALAGPAMNFVLAAVALALVKVFLVAGIPAPAETLLRLAQLSIFLAYFNLLPVPPLDGSHVARYLFGISEQTFHQIAQFGFIILIVLINLPPVNRFLGLATVETFRLLARAVGLPY